MFNEKRSSMLHGVLLIALFSCAAFYIGEMSFVRSISFSPMIVGIILGMLYANSLRNHLPETWVPGIQLLLKEDSAYRYHFIWFQIDFSGCDGYRIAGYADRCDYCGCDYLWRHLSW